MVLLLQVQAFAAFAQERLDWKPIAEIPVDRLEQLALDNRGQIYFADGSGGIYQLDRLGNAVNHFSWERRGRITHLDADRTVNIFAFSETLQEYVILDRFLNPVANKRVDETEVGFAQSATLGNNNALWLFDESNLELIRLDYRRQQVMQQQPLGLVLGKEDLQVKEIREYRNSLYLRSSDAVYVFDNQGNYLKSLPYDRDAKLAFYQDNLFYVQMGSLVRLNLQSGERIRYSLPSGLDRHDVQLQGEAIAFYDRNRVFLYQNPF